MKYVLVYLIRGRAEKYHQRLVKNVGPKFNENYMVENPLPSHVTLKYPFKKRQIKYLEKILEDFSKEHKRVKIGIEGFGNFRRFVAFLKVKFPKEAKNLQHDLLEEIKDIKGIEIQEFDRNHKPHATITYGNNKNSFNKIWNYLGKLDNPKFDLYFDNITILKKPGRYWKIHKIYELK